MGKGEEDGFEKKSPLSNTDSKRYGPSNLIWQFVNWVKAQHVTVNLNAYLQWEVPRYNNDHEL